MVKEPKAPKQAKQTRKPKETRTRDKPTTELIAYSKEELQSFFEQDLWLRSNGQQVPLRQMNDFHILSTIEKINREGPDSYGGLGFQWLPKLVAEIQRRSDEDPADDHKREQSHYE